MRNRSAFGSAGLGPVISRLVSNQSPAVIMQFSKVLKDMVDNHEWVHIPVIEDSLGQRFKIINSRGRAYAAMYSDPSEAKARGKVAVTDINKLLEPVFANPSIGGIVIDPDTTVFCLDKEYLLKCILHGYLPEQKNNGVPNRNWGRGIPKYRPSDVMSEGELLNFAMERVLDAEESFSDLIPVSACDSTDALANFIFKESSGGFVLVRVLGFLYFHESLN